MAGPTEIRDGSVISSPDSSSSTRYTPRSVEEDDDDKTLVMSARSMDDGSYEMKELGDIGQEGMGLLAEEKAQGRKKKLRLDTSGAAHLEEVDLDELEDVGRAWTVQEEKAVIKKLDRRVVLFVALLYLLSFLDRSNIGNARIAGLETDLQLSSSQYEWLLSGFYITYIAFEWMALLFRVIPPHIYISIVVLAWGLLASLQSISTSFSTLLILRAALGAFEAAFAGVPFYLSFFFRREELASRVGVFISAAPLATTFASSLAWAITWLGSRFSIWAPWRLLFLVEGFPSVIVAAWVWRSLPDGPESAKFLSRREKEIAQLRLVSEKEDESSSLDEKKIGQDQQASGKKKLKMSEIIKALKDPKCYLTASMFFSCNVAFSSMPVFLPTIIREMGWSSTMSQALSAPPYLISFAVVLFTSYASDKAKTRSPFIIFHALLACGGYVLIFLAGALGLPGWIRYLGVYPATAGFFSCVTLIITWTLNNQATDSAKGTGVALLQYFGQCGPLLGTRLYPENEGPLYLKGMAVCASFMGLVAALAWGLRWVLVRENKQIAEGQGVWEELGQDDELDEDVEGVKNEVVKARRREPFVFML